jgi:membrane protease YdiL (CAAX protease family)
MSGSQPRWGRIALYLLLVFSLSWGTMFIFQQGGDRVPPLGMLIPALVAICMRAGSLRDAGPAGWILSGFLLLVLLQLTIAVFAVVTAIPGSILGGIVTWSMIGWTLLVIRLYRKQGEEGFARAGLQLGNRSNGLRIAIGCVLFLVIQGLADLSLGTGRNIFGTVPVVDMSLPDWIQHILLVFVLALSIVGTPLGGLALFFGEEYGWRGFLQDELGPIGRRTAALAIGLVWGIWHIPIILSGTHTYPPTAQGFVLAAVFFSLWGSVQSYAVYATGSIWTAAILHGIFNGLFSFLRTYIVRPTDKIFSFGLGLYGAVCLALIVLFIWRDPAWGARAEQRT